MPSTAKLSKQTRGQGAVKGFPRLLGERLCLYFVNTIDPLIGESREEFLHSYEDVVRWGFHVGLLTEEEVSQARVKGSEQPEWAADLFTRVLRLREALTRLFTDIAHQRAPQRDDVHLLEIEHLAATTRIALQREGDNYAWMWQGSDRAVDYVLWKVVRSTLSVLETDDLSRVKQCPGANDCGGLFYDTSRNGTRRWCSMEGCGSRVKMRRQYARHLADSKT